MGPIALPVCATVTTDPVQARAMDKADIADLRRWHREAVRRALHGRLRPRLRLCRARARRAAAFPLAPLQHTAPTSTAAAWRTAPACCARCSRTPGAGATARAAVACRIAVDELLGDGRHHAARTSRTSSARSASCPTCGTSWSGRWEDDSITSRFGRGGRAGAVRRGLKALTTKPVVGVGRFTSPDTMVRQIRDGLLDLIGAARPSIADPFLPQQDRGGPAGGHPRVHRLQHLRLRRLHACRRSAARRTRPWARSGGAAGTRSGSAPQRTDATGAGRRRRAGRAGGGAVARASAATRSILAERARDARRPRRARGRAARAGRVDPGRRLPRAAARAS